MPDQPTIHLLTSGFPFKGREPYLNDEIEVVQDEYDIILYPSKPRSEPTEFGIRSLFGRSRLKDYLFAFKVCLSESRFLLRTRKFRYYLSLMAQCSAKSRELIENCSPGDVIYAYWSNELATIAAICAARRSDLICVSRAHGFDVFEDQTRYGYIPFRCFQLKHLKGLFSVSQRGVDHLREKNPRYSDKIFLSYLGTLNPHEFRVLSDSNPNGLVIATCSNIRAIKRLTLLAEALRECTFPVTWHVIGDGSALEDLKKACMELPSNVHVDFKGRMDQKQIIKFYATNRIDALLSTSYSEGLPVSMMEALSCGIPVISTDVGGCSEIVTNESGMLIPSNPTADQVLNALTSFLHNGWKNASHRKAARSFWERNFNAASNYGSFYKRIPQHA